MGAHKYVNIDTPQPDAGDLPDVVMTYLYDAGGNRVVREQSNIAAGEEEIYQDVYLGSLERRHVQLLDGMGIARSIHSAQEGLHFVNVGDTRQVHYGAGARLQWKVPETGGVMGALPQIFLSFGNHLGSTSVVIDYESGALVEWNTYYAYGADESRWKNTDAQYDNAEEPYGFTGKEEDDAVGLHYFGARYYSSHLGRWLTPDPPVIHGGGLGNYYNYGGNSPYIYVDPDGNWIHIVVGAVIGAITGGIMGAIKGIKKGKGPWGVIGHSIAGSIIGAASGAAIAATGGAAAGAAGTAAGGAGAGAAATFTSATGLTAALKTGGALAYAMASAGAAAGWNFAQTAIETRGNFQQAGISAGISFGASIISTGVGGAASGLDKFGRAAVGFAAGVGVSYGATALTSGVNSENWDDVLLSSAVGAAASAIGNAVGAEIQGVGKSNEGMLSYLSADSDAAPKPLPGVADYDKEFRKQVEIVNNLKNSDQSGRKVAIIFENLNTKDPAQKEFDQYVLPVLAKIYQDKGYDVLVFRDATKSEYERIMAIGFKQRAISVWGHGEEPPKPENTFTPGGRNKLSDGDWMSMDVFNITPPGTRNDSIFFGVCWAGKQVHHISWANSTNAWASPNKYRMDVFLWDFIDFMEQQR